MNESPCPVEGCREPLPHEHRAYRYTIVDDHHWYDLRESDVRLLNEARTARGEPLLIFGSTQTQAEQLIWGPATGIQAAPEEKPHEV